ncbi:MAG: radical SAM protein [Acidobacteria bacterium]|nr:MAG: radical SAM protein [Acidobacteriota bacterium]
MSLIEHIDRKIRNNERINTEEAAWLYRCADLNQLRTWAGIARSRYHKSNRATYLIMRIVNYTNVCVARCDYCAFYRLPNSPEGYVLSREQIFEKMDEIMTLGGDFVGFNGGFNPKLDINWYCELFRDIRKKYGERIEFYGLTVAELMYVAKKAKISYYEAAATLKKAGNHWITGGGAEVLTNAFRKRHSPQKYTADDFMDAQKQIIEAGVQTTGTMVIGFDESIEERLEHLSRVRALQDETHGGLFSFLCWSYKPDHTVLGGEELAREDYWRHLAVSRIFLDNVKHIRTSVLTQNEHALTGLHYGADDFDIPFEDEVTQMAGAVINRDLAAVIRQCRSEGFEPVFRKTARDSQADFHQRVV